MSSLNAVAPCSQDSIVKAISRTLSLAGTSSKQLFPASWVCKVTHRLPGWVQGVRGLSAQNFIENERVAPGMRF